MEVGLAESSDAEICRYAIEKERVIVSKDQDFFYLAGQLDSKIRLLWVRLGNCRTTVLLAAFDQFWPMIETSLQAGDRVVELR